MCHWECEQTCEGGEDRTANNLNGPHGIEKARLVSAPALDDNCADADVGEHCEACHEHAHEQHQAERFGYEQPAEDQVAAETQGVFA